MNPTAGLAAIVVAVLKPYAAMWRKSSPRESVGKEGCAKAQGMLAALRGMNIIRIDK